MNSLWIVLVILAVLIGVVLWYLNRLLRPEAMEQRLEAMVNKVFGLTANQLASQSQQVLHSEQELIKTQLSHTSLSLQRLVDELSKDLKARQQELHSAEQNRVKSFAELNTTLEQHRELTKELQTSTDTLAKVLSNNQQRGEWGERIIEDLLASSGFVEGVHYLRQARMEDSIDRPDITLMLPNKRIVPLDVKFPYSELQKLSRADTKAQKDVHEKQFGVDVKNKIKKVAGYIRPEAGTLDYALLFVPNEFVFSFINQRYPDLISEAMRQRVLLVSPFTVMIVIKTIMESYRNFMMETNLRGIIKSIGQFAKEWQMFQDDFDKLGMTLTKASEGYQAIRDRRYRQLTTRIEKIEQLKGKADTPELISE